MQLNTSDIGHLYLFSSQPLLFPPSMISKYIPIDYTKSVTMGFVQYY